MANNTHRLAFVRTGGALLLLLAGLWAADLAPLGAFGPPPLRFGEAGAPETADAPAPQLKGMSSSAGRRITTVSIETSDPVAYVTSRPDPLTLFIDLARCRCERRAQRIARREGHRCRRGGRRSDGRRRRARRARAHPADRSRPRIRCAASATSFTSISTARFRWARVGNASATAPCTPAIVAVRDDARKRARRGEADRRQPSR